MTPTTGQQTLGQAKPSLTFAQVIAEHDVLTKPPLVVPVPLSWWAQDWGDRPTGDTEVGIRIPSEGDLVCIRAEADRKSVELYPDGGDGQTEAYNSLLMSGVVTAALCQPHDAKERWWDEAQGDISRALTSAAIEALFWHTNKLLITDSPTSPEASLEDIGALVELLRSGEVWRTLDGAAARRVRRMLRHCLDEMTAPTA